MKKLIITAVAVITLIAGWLYFVKGYSGIRKRQAVPTVLAYKARVPGMENIRVMVDPIRLKKSGLRTEVYGSGLAEAKFPNHEVNILAISGGGANGAYGAGILCGWTETKKRPVFDMVTGVSTGALTAPAAFLGPSYDKVIREIYTNVSNADIIKQDLLEFFFEGRPSIFDTQPLRAVLRNVVTKEVLDDVAREHIKGRRLYVATTNLDSKRLVIWDMGAIAASGKPGSLELFRNVMLASASIPVAFPPVMITVEADGRLYDEMHVDGSVTTQLFGPMLVTGKEDLRRRDVNIYAIRNGKFADVPEEVPYKVWDIAGAAFTTLITWQGYGDIYRFVAMAKYEHFRFYFACIPYEFSESSKGGFDLEYMRKLFYRGYRSSLSGGHWMKQVGNRFQDDAPNS